MTRPVPKDAPALIRLTIDIPITDDVVTPDDLPTAGDVLGWLTDEYRSPCGLVADFDQNAKVDATVLWQYGIANAKWTAAHGWFG